MSSFFGHSSASKRYEAPAAADERAGRRQRPSHELMDAKEVIYRGDAKEVAAIKIQSITRGNSVRRSSMFSIGGGGGSSVAKPQAQQATRSQSYSDRAQSQRSKVMGAGAIQRTFELNKQAVDDVLLGKRPIEPLTRSICCLSADGNAFDPRVYIIQTPRTFSASSCCA